jgi:hypothetical protein
MEEEKPLTTKATKYHEKQSMKSFVILGTLLRKQPCLSLSGYAEHSDRAKVGARRDLKHSHHEEHRVARGG